MLSFFKKETPAVAVPKSNLDDLINDGNDYFSDELICLDEKLKGNLFCAEKVVVDQHGELTGNITSKTCLVTGVVNGNITSLDLLDIKASAVVRGNIQSATVNIEPGAVINGYITVGENIEALTEQWNRTKFSTDDYLTMKLNKELASLNKISTSSANVGTGKIEPGLVAAVTKNSPIRAAEPLKAAQSKPLSAASSNQQQQPKQELTAAKPVLAAVSSQEQQENTPPAPVAAAKSLTAAAPQPKAQEQENNSRWW